MPAPYFGKIKLYWCKKHNIPVVSKKQSCCKGDEIYRVDISPPGDIRPAFKGDYEVLNSTFIGLSKILDGFLSVPVLLNHVSALDRMEEIIIDGSKIGVLNFKVKDWKYEFFPSVDGAKILFSYVVGKIRRFDKALKTFKHVIVDEGAENNIMKGHNVMAPGVISSSKFFRNDIVFIVSENNALIGVGKAIVDSESLDGLKKGVVIKNKTKNLFLPENDAWSIYQDTIARRERLREFTESIIEKFGCNNEKTELLQDEYDPFELFPDEVKNYWVAIIYCNKDHLIEIEKEAIGFIKSIVINKDDKILVSFSGGKDSITVLNLAIKAKINYLAYFVDTGIEFPETVKYVEKVLTQIAKKHDKKVESILYNDKTIIMTDHTAIVRVPKNKFWQGVKRIGFPGMDWRWCCKSNKLAPTKILVSKIKGKVKFNIEGIRKYESASRAKEGRINKNIWTQLTNVYPIYYWNALELWLYILKNRLPINPLYSTGLYRIGCWPCPSNHLADLQIIQKTHPKLFQKLKETIISQLKQTTNQPEEIWKQGTWRWKNPPKKTETKTTTPRPTQKLITITKQNHTHIIQIKNNKTKTEKAIQLINTLLRKYKNKIHIEEKSSRNNQT